jgi:hypothetical protein
VGAAAVAATTCGVGGAYKENSNRRCGLAAGAATVAAATCRVGGTYKENGSRNRCRLATAARGGGNCGGGGAQGRRLRMGLAARTKKTCVELARSLLRATVFSSAQIRPTKLHLFSSASVKLTKI